jgi:hypothetical protein
MRALLRQMSCLVILAALLVAVAPGCSKSGLPSGRNRVTGKLTKNGQPLQFDATFDAIDLYFIPMQGDKRPAVRELEGAPAPGPPRPPGGDVKEEEPIRMVNGTVAADSTFEVYDGLPDGKYLVTVRIFPKGRPDDQTPLDRVDVFKGAFGAVKSKIIREVKGDTKIDIDLGKPEG